MSSELGALAAKFPGRAGSDTIGYPAFVQAVVGQRTRGASALSAADAAVLARREMRPSETLEVGTLCRA